MKEIKSTDLRPSICGTLQTFISTANMIYIKDNTNENK